VKVTRPPSPWQVTLAICPASAPLQAKPAAVIGASGAAPPSIAANQALATSPATPQSVPLARTSRMKPPTAPGQPAGAPPESAGVVAGAPPESDGVVDGVVGAVVVVLGGAVAVVVAVAGGAVAVVPVVAGTVAGGGAVSVAALSRSSSPPQADRPIAAATPNRREIARTLRRTGAL
jgi:hypothetical protein